MILKPWEGYISKVARRYKKISPILSEEDIAQEASIVILKCYREFPSLPESILSCVVKKSIKNRIIDLLRASKRNGDQVSVQVDVSRLSIPISAFDSFFIETAIQQMKDQLGQNSVKVLDAVLQSEGRKQAVRMSGLSRWEFYRTLKSLKAALYNSICKPCTPYNRIEVLGEVL